MSPATHHPTTLILLGATGDLAQTKIYAALADLDANSLLPSDFRIVAFARKSFTDETYRNLVRRWVADASPGRDASPLIDRIHYVRGDFDDDASYERLQNALIEFDATAHRACSNKLFYLAIPPSLYENVLQRIALSGLTIPCADKTGWTRVLIEKPFGSDLTTARTLDRQLGLLFKEEQVFRIDHYLAKETLQNILAFRFANGIFEPLWNREHIERVEILRSESRTVGARSAFFDGIGELKDVGQNHALQMLALVAMERPESFSAQDIRRRRAEVLQSLDPVRASNAVRGRYESYASEPGVKVTSTTETAFAVEAHLSTPRWRGVPFLIGSGKGFADGYAVIRIRFKRPDVCMFGVSSCESGNVLEFRIQPEEGIAISFFSKKPGFGAGLEERHLSFNYGASADSVRLPDAYERVLFDCIRGDQTLFASTTEVDESWRFTASVIESWEERPMHEYPRGTKLEEWMERVLPSVQCG